MSISVLPKELRLQIWNLVYFSQSQRLVQIATRPHDEEHGEDVFCPRYSPSPAPIVVNICRESRAEARYQALKAGHVVTMPSELETAPGTEFYFRFDTDILFLPLDGANVKHYDDSPEVGLLAHFRKASGCTPTLLQNIAVTNVVSFGYFDGSLSNVLCEFPNISRMIMMIMEDIWDDKNKKETFIHAALRIALMYRFDMEKRASNLGRIPDTLHLIPEIASLDSKNGLQIVPIEVWDGWTARQAD